MCQGPACHAGCISLCYTTAETVWDSNMERSAHPTCFPNTHQEHLVCSGTKEYCATRTAPNTTKQIMPGRGCTQIIQIWSAHAIPPQQQLFVLQAASSQMKSAWVRQTWQGQSSCWQVQLTCEPCWCRAGPSSSESASQLH